MKRVFHLLLVTLALASCRRTEALDLKKPESVAATKKFLYVSNINGSPTERDGNGYISKLYHNGKAHTNAFIQGLNAPKGMVIVDHILYVTDIDRVLGFELGGGTKVFECVLINKSEFLNDICYDGNGHLYVSAMDINEIFEINIKNKSIRNLGLADQLISPNGLAWHDGTLYVCEFDRDSANGCVKSIEFKNDSTIVTSLTDHTGYLDGLCYFEGKLYFSDWVDFDEKKEPAQILALDLGTKQVTPVKTSETMSGCADIYLDAGSKTIIAPLMRENKILFVPL